MRVSVCERVCVRAPVHARMGTWDAMQTVCITLDGGPTLSQAENHCFGFLALLEQRNY